jgi:hypothetical protein
LIIIDSLLARPATGAFAFLLNLPLHLIEDRKNTPKNIPRIPIKKIISIAITAKRLFAP